MIAKPRVDLNATTSLQLLLKPAFDGVLIHYFPRTNLFNRKGKNKFFFSILADIQLTKLRPVGMSSQLKEKSFVKFKTAWELLHNLPSTVNKK